MHTGCGSRIQFTDADHRRATGRQGSPSKFSRNTAPWRWHRCAAGIIRGIALLLPYCFGGEALSKNGVVGWFNSLPRLAQLILLLIPGVNWVIEILVRWSSFIHTKSVLALIFAILVTFFGFGFGWLDLLWCLLFKHMICAKG